MKTNIHILALLMSASIVNAAKPVLSRNLTSIPVSKPSAMPMSKPSPAVPRNPGALQLSSSASNRVPLKPSFNNHAAPNLGSRSLPVKPAAGTITQTSRLNTGISRPPLADPRVAGFSRGNAAGLSAGHDIAGALRDINNLRNVLPEGLKQFGIKGNTPSRSGLDLPNFGDESSFNNGSRGVKNPLDRFSSSKPRDIRGAVSSGRRAGDMDTSGDWPLPNGYMSADGSTHTVTATEHQSSTRHYNPDGKYSGRTEESWGRSLDHTTAQHFDSEGHHTSTVMIERRSDGTEQKTVYREGQAPEVTNSDDTTPTKSCDRNPSEGASLGGASRPGMKQVSGLTNLDLLRQLAEGQQSGGGVNYMVSGRLGSNQVRPDDVGARPRTDRGLSTPSVINPETKGGYTGGGDRPD